MQQEKENAQKGKVSKKEEIYENDSIRVSVPFSRPYPFPAKEVWPRRSQRKETEKTLKMSPRLRTKQKA